MSFLEKLDKMDRRIIFLLIAIVVFVPLLFKYKMKVPARDEVKAIYNKIESLPEGSVVLFSFDYDPSTLAELQPMAKAVLKHLMRKKIKIVFAGLWPQGPKLADEVLKDVNKKFHYKKGIDYTNLGYKQGGIVVISSMASSIKDTFPTIADGTSYDEIPLLRNIHTLKDFSFIISLSAGDPGITHWMMIAKDRFGVPVAGGCTAVSAPQIYPYLNSHQLLGLMGGLNGAAQYETLISDRDQASLGMTAQTFAHALIILLIILGNITMFLLKRKRNERRAA